MPPVLLRRYISFVKEYHPIDMHAIDRLLSDIRYQYHVVILCDLQKHHYHVARNVSVELDSAVRKVCSPPRTQPAATNMV